MPLRDGHGDLRIGAGLGRALAIGAAFAAAAAVIAWVPAESSYVVVTVGDTVRVLTVGAVPARIAELAPATAAAGVLPPVRAFRTGAAG